MTETEIDEVDLALLAVVELMKTYGISLRCSRDIINERMIELWPEVEPSPTHDAPNALQ